MQEKLKEIEKLVIQLEKSVKKISRKTDLLWDFVFGKEEKKLEFPLEVYVDDNFRENYLKQQNKKPVKVVILDDNPLSIASYMEDHPEVSFEDSSDLNVEDKIKLKKQLDKIRDKNLTAEDLVNQI